MLKKVVIDKGAQKEIGKFSLSVQKECKAHFVLLEEKGRLESPIAKKIDKNLFEIRIKMGDAYRIFYAYVTNPFIVILHSFKKKTQKTPIKNLKLARKRLKYYE